MIGTLRPGYNPPSAKDIGGKLLDNAAEDIELQLIDTLESSSLTLIQDGWSSVQNDPILATSIHTGTETYLLNAVDAGSEKKTGKYCASKAEAIEECKENFYKEIFAIVTYNENKMTKMRELLCQKYPNLITYVCSAHLLNLVEKEVSPKTVLKRGTKIFSSTWMAERKNELMPQIPTDTRWNSHPACIKTFVANYHKYREIALEHIHEIDQNFSKILENMGIYHEVVHLEKQLTFVASALNKLQSDSTTLSGAVEVWLDLLSEEILQPYKQHFQKRFEQAIQPFHLLASIMEFRGKRLSSEQESKAKEWIISYHPEYLSGILAFKINDSDYYPTSMMQGSVIDTFSSSKWWQILGKRTKHSSRLPPGF